MGMRAPVTGRPAPEAVEVLAEYVLAVAYDPILLLIVFGMFAIGLLGLVLCALGLYCSRLIRRKTVNRLDEVRGETCLDSPS